MRLKVIALVGLAASSPATAADICTATVLHDIPGGSYSYSAKRGEKLVAVTQYVVDGKHRNFCAHGGGCYSAFVRIRGKLVKAVSLDNCTVNFSKPDVSPYDTIYGLDVDRRRNSAATLRYDDLDNRFLDMGLCYACASTAANEYMRRPASPCGRLASSALKGNREARLRLFAAKNACTAEWGK